MALFRKFGLVSWIQRNAAPAVAPRSLFSIISTFVWRQSSHLFPAKKKKGKLFSCLIWTLIICQKWLFDCVSSLGANPRASELVPSAQASAHVNSVSYANVCLAPSVFAGPLAGFNHRRRWSARALSCCAFRAQCPLCSGAKQSDS